MIDVTTCAECGSPAEVLWRAVLPSTDGPVEHVRTLCVRRHWLLMAAGASEARTTLVRTAVGAAR